MDIEFDNIEQLYKRVLPALTSKKKELKRYGYDINEITIWNFLSETIFKYSKDLTLADIVSNIMHIDIIELEKYLKK